MASTASSRATQVQHTTQNVREFKQNREHYNNNNNYNNNTTRARVERVIDRATEGRMDAALHGDFASVFEDSIGRPLPRIVAREISEMMARGISGGLIMAVIEYTAGAPRPSWAYARAVILRNFAKGINDEDEFNESVGGLGTW